MGGGGQLRQAAGCRALDGAAGDAGDPRDVGLAEVLVVAKDDDLPFTAGEATQGTQNAVAVGVLVLTTRGVEASVRELRRFE